VTRPAAVEAPRPSFGWRWLAPLIFVFLWSGGFAVAKIGLRDSTPMAFLAVRYLLVIVVLAVLLAIVRPPLPAHWRSYGHLAVTGFCIQVLYFGLSYLGFWLGASAGGLALIVCLQPILVGLLAPGLVSESVNWQRWAGLALGLSGAAIVIIARSEVDLQSLPGTLCAVGALAGITAGTLYEKRFGLNHHPVLANFVQYLVGFAVIGPLPLLVETPAIHFTQSFLLCLAYLVVGNSLIAVTLLLAMIRAGEASRVSALFFLVPPVAAAMAFVAIGEIMPPAAWLGMAVAALGVAIASRT
jgi:drug/metabolite transporter (DMT)-like permease